MFKYKRPNSVRHSTLKCEIRMIYFLSEPLSIKKLSFKIFKLGCGRSCTACRSFEWYFIVRKPRLKLTVYAFDNASQRVLTKKPD